MNPKTYRRITNTALVTGVLSAVLYDRVPSLSPLWMALAVLAGLSALGSYCVNVRAVSPAETTETSVPNRQVPVVLFSVDTHIDLPAKWSFRIWESEPIRITIPREEAPGFLERNVWKKQTPLGPVRPLDAGLWSDFVSNPSAKPC